MSTLAIIPARGSSKGLPRKNIAPVAGRPLIAWSIMQSLDACYVDRTIVSTDCEEIASVARELGAEVPFLRPAEFARDESSTESVMLHALEALGATGFHPDLVLLLQPTCPVRRPGRIDAAVDKLRGEDADSLVAVREIHPFLWREPNNAKALYDFMNRPRRQDLNPKERLFEETGSIYITRRQTMEQTRNRLGGRIILFPMDQKESIDIDSADELQLAGHVLKEMYGL